MRQMDRRDFMKTAGTAVLGVSVQGCVTPQLDAAMRPPNILLVFPDQHRFDWTQMNPEIPVRTPHLARLAREGVTFEKAVCPAPLCAPSRVCLALGKAYGNTSVISNKQSLPENSETLYTRLRDGGYRVGSVGKLDLHKPGFCWGPDGQHNENGTCWFNEWGFTDGLDSEGKGDSFNGIKKDKEGNPVGVSPYTKMLHDRKDGSLQRYLQWKKDRGLSGLKNTGFSYLEPIQLDDDAYNDNWVGQNGLELIENFPEDQPWFLQVNFPGPHSPMDVTPNMATWYADTDFPQPHANDQLDPDTHTGIRRHYAAMIENIDRWLGKYLDALEARGELGNTLIVFSSDHGEMLGDHNCWSKRVPYQPSLSVPLVISGAGTRKNYKHTGPAETLDLTATFLDYAGIPIPEEMDSRSLRSLLHGVSDTHREIATAGLLPWRMAFDGRYKLIRGFSPTHPKFSDTLSKDHDPDILLLFDLKNDPRETRNLVQDHPEIVARLLPHLPENHLIEQEKV